MSSFLMVKVNLRYGLFYAQESYTDERLITVCRKLCVCFGFSKIYTVTMDNVLESFYTKSRETAGNHACHKLFTEISRLETVLIEII